MARKITVLKRFGHKGQFVHYPAKWQRRMTHTGKRRFDTSCDLLIGMCACGERHYKNECWVQDMLRHHKARIETHEEWLARTREEAALTT